MLREYFASLTTYALNSDTCRGAISYCPTFFENCTYSSPVKYMMLSLDHAYLHPRLLRMKVTQNK